MVTTYTGLETGATFIGPTGLAFGSDGTLFVADYNMGTLQLIDGSGAASLLAAFGPVGVAVDAKGVAYGNETNRYLAFDASGRRPFAGTGEAGFSGDGGPAVDAQFGLEVLGVAVGPQGQLYLGDPSNHRIRMVDAAGRISTIAGTGASNHSGDGGPAIEAGLERPSSIAVDADGSVVFVDQSDWTVRRIGTDGRIETLAGGAATKTTGDCGPARRG